MERVSATALKLAAGLEHLAFAGALELLFPAITLVPGVAASAVVHATAEVRGMKPAQLAREVLEAWLRKRR